MSPDTAQMGASGLVDRHPQNLPVPIGGTSPVHLLRPRRRRLVRRHGPALLSSAAALMTVIGLALLLVPVRVDAFLAAGGVTIGSTTLHLIRSDGTMTLYGGAAWYALVEPGDGTARAAAVWGAGGTSTVATCAMRRNAGRIVDECTFVTGSTRLTCVDVLTLAAGPTWQRTYADGTQVEIGVPPGGAAIPVAFPVGH